MSEIRIFSREKFDCVDCVCVQLLTIFFLFLDVRATGGKEENPIIDAILVMELLNCYNYNYLLF